MAIDTWFPLAIYRTHLKENSQHKDGLLERIWQFREARPKKRTDKKSSWTGDIHGIDMLHMDPAFDWITQQVGKHAALYLEALGHNLSLYDLYFQRSWPIIGGKKQGVSPHAHPTAHLSAVYYVSIPAEGPPGKICFLNDARPNELFEGLGSHMTNGYKTQNPLNTHKVNYEPADGWLFIFPSSLRHFVESNNSTGYRISLSYDLILTSAEQGSLNQTPEFLMPSPTRWRKAIIGSKASPAHAVFPPRGSSSLATVPKMNTLRTPKQHSPQLI